MKVNYISMFVVLVDLIIYMFISYLSRLLLLVYRGRN